MFFAFVHRSSNLLNLILVARPYQCKISSLVHCFALFHINRIFVQQIENRNNYKADKNSSKVKLVRKEFTFNNHGRRETE